MHLKTSSEESKRKSSKLSSTISISFPSRRANCATSDATLKLWLSSIARSPMFPDDVRLPIERAGRLHFFTEDQDEALKAAELAAERAKRTNRRVSEALCLKARILVRLKRGEELAQTLEDMIALEPLQVQSKRASPLP